MHVFLKMGRAYMLQPGSTWPMDHTVQLAALVIMRLHRATKVLSIFLSLSPIAIQMGSMARSTVENGRGTANSNGNMQPNHETMDGSDPPAPNGNSAGNTTETDGSRKRKTAGVLPLEVGTRVMCRWRDGKFHPVKVIERRKISSGGPNDYEYYVHYTECQYLLSLQRVRVRVSIQGSYLLDWGLGLGFGRKIVIRMGGR